MATGEVAQWERDSTQWEQAAAKIVLPPANDFANAKLVKNGVTLWHERELQAHGEELALERQAQGEQAARQHVARARSLDASAAATKSLLGIAEQEVRQAQSEYQVAAKALGPYVRREPGASWRYRLCWVILWLGDTAGVLSALVMNGEIPLVGLPLGLSAGLAAVCAGLVGSELKNIRLSRARQRDADGLTEEERRYAWLFVGNSRGRGVGMVMLVGLLSVLVVVLIAGGIGMLRAGIEGVVAGRTFACLAAATAIASGLVGYWAADDVADLLSVLQRRVRRAEKHYMALAGHESLRTQAQAAEAARSIQVEYDARGRAGAKRLEALRYRILRLNPLVAGHGYLVDRGESGQRREAGHAGVEQPEHGNGWITGEAVSRS